MTPDQFIYWLKGFLGSKHSLDPQDTFHLKQHLSGVSAAKTESTTNEASKKKILHD